MKQTSFGDLLDRLIERTLARIDRHAGERRIAEPAKVTKVKKHGRPKNPNGAQSRKRGDVAPL